MHFLLLFAYNREDYWEKCKKHPCQRTRTTGCFHNGTKSLLRIASN